MNGSLNGGYHLFQIRSRRHLPPEFIHICEYPFCAVNRIVDNQNWKDDVLGRWAGMHVSVKNPLEVMHLRSIAELNFLNLK